MSNLISKKLKLDLQVEGEDGKFKTKSKTFSNINLEVEDEVLKMVGEDIASLQIHPEDGIKKVEEWNLKE